MKAYYVDTEFHDTGKEIDLISIGIVSSDGREYYAQSAEFDPRQVRKSAWLEANVMSNLVLCPHVHTRGEHSAYVDQVVHQQRGQCVDQQRGYLHNCPWRSKKQIMHEVSRFFQPDDEHEPFELVSWCGAYDFVALCQLFGTMMDLPTGWPHYIRDLQQILDEREITDEDLPQQEGIAHHALADAKHIKRLWEYVVGDESQGNQFSLAETKQRIYGKFLQKLEAKYPGHPWTQVQPTEDEDNLIGLIEAAGYGDASAILLRTAQGMATLHQISVTQAVRDMLAFLKTDGDAKL